MLSPSAVSVNQVLAAIRSFPQGSAGGQDGLRPQHQKDLTDRQVGGTVLESLTSFVNFVLSGLTPLWVRPFLFGAALLAFGKKDSGVRPIAVGSISLRVGLVAKVACHSVSDRCAAVFKPRQLGVGVTGGAEALVHDLADIWITCHQATASLSSLTSVMHSTQCAGKTTVREGVATCYIPDLLGYFDSCLRRDIRQSILRREYTIDSAEGVQQGVDPLGLPSSSPLPFIISYLLSSRNSYPCHYLDDLGIGGLRGR